MEIKWIYDADNCKARLPLPLDDGGKIKLYKQINKVAELFEENMEHLLQVKQDTIASVKGKKKNMMSDDELENFLLKYIRV